MNNMAFCDNIDELNDYIAFSNVLVYFYADWCGKCKLLSKELEQVNLVKIIRVDADKNRDICKKYGVMSLPTLIYFKSDGSFFSRVGFMSYDDIIEFIKK